MKTNTTTQLLTINKTWMGRIQYIKDFIKHHASLNISNNSNPTKKLTEAKLKPYERIRERISDHRRHEKKMPYFWPSPPTFPPEATSEARPPQMTLRHGPDYLEAGWLMR